MRNSISDTELHPDAIALIENVAARDACDVALFLKHLALASVPGAAVCLTKSLLLELGAALHLLRWEEQGLTVHREIGLPAAMDAIVSAFRAGITPGNDHSRLSDVVLRIHLERFSWYACTELKADIFIGTPDEEAFLDSLADFLWANRDRGRLLKEQS